MWPLHPWNKPDRQTADSRPSCDRRSRFTRSTEARAAAGTAETNERRKSPSRSRPASAACHPRPSLFPDTTAGDRTKSLGSIYAPWRLIPCETIITVDLLQSRRPSSSIAEDVHHAGKLVFLPAPRFTARRRPTAIASASKRQQLTSCGIGRGASLERLALIASRGSALGSRTAAKFARARHQIRRSGRSNCLPRFFFRRGHPHREGTNHLRRVESRSLNNARSKGAEKVLSVYARIYDAFSAMASMFA
jgi:hypothetical protein